MKALPKYKDINVNNDLTKTERAREKELWEEAKKMKDKDDSRDYEYKVRGPPWARQMAKIKQQKEIKGLTVYIVGRRFLTALMLISLQFYPN